MTKEVAPGTAEWWKSRYESLEERLAEIEHENNELRRAVKHTLRRLEEMNQEQRDWLWANRTPEHQKDTDD